MVPTGPSMTSLNAGFFITNPIVNFNSRLLVDVKKRKVDIAAGSILIVNIINKLVAN